MAHTHHESARAWREYVTDDPLVGGYAVAYNYHGYCMATGTHLMTARCACGAERLSCAIGPTRWIAQDDEATDDDLS